MGVFGSNLLLQVLYKHRKVELLETCVRHYYRIIFGNSEKKLIVVGLNGSGKTILENLCFFITSESINPWDFKIETVNFANKTANVWDLNSNYSMPPVSIQLTIKTRVGCGGRIFSAEPKVMFNLGVIVVIDSSNRNQISSVKGKLVRLLSNKCLRDVPLLIYAHKQDLPQPMTVEEIKEKLNLSILNGGKFFVQLSYYLGPSSNSGLIEGFQWLGNALKN